MSDTLKAQSIYKFYGRDANECEDFIRALGFHAFAMDKTEDNRWIAEQALPCFIGGALQWYIGQPFEVRHDWTLLQKAMLSTWNPSDEVISQEPVPAAARPAAIPAPVPLSHDAVQAMEITGRILVQSMDGSDSVARYLSTHLNESSSEGQLRFLGSYLVTEDPELAMKVRLIPTNSRDWGHMKLQIMNHEAATFLAIYMGGYGKRDPGMLIGVTNPRMVQGGVLEGTTYRGNRPAPRFGFKTWQFESDQSLFFTHPSWDLGNARWQIGEESTLVLNRKIGPDQPVENAVKLVFIPDGSYTSDI